LCANWIGSFLWWAVVSLFRTNCIKCCTLPSDGQIFHPDCVQIGLVLSYDGLSCACLFRTNCIKYCTQNWPCIRAWTKKNPKSAKGTKISKFDRNLCKLRHLLQIMKICCSNFMNLTKKSHFLQQILKLTLLPPRSLQFLLKNCKSEIYFRCFTIFKKLLLMSVINPIFLNFGCKIFSDSLRLPSSNDVYFFYQAVFDVFKNVTKF